MVKYRFRVRLRQFRASDLPGKDLDPFVKVNFDSFKKFTTNSVSGNNPKWDTDSQFVYETQYADKLHRKRVVLQVYSKNTLSSDDLVGQVDVDLKTLACGPTAQDVQLWNGPSPAGRLHFNCEMEEVGSITLFVKDMLVSGLPMIEGESPTTHVVCAVTSHLEHKKKDKVEIKTESKAGTTDPEFQTFEQLRFNATVKELWGDHIEVRIYSDVKKRLGLIGTAKLPFEKYHSFKELALVSFKEDVHITHEFKATVCSVQGQLYFKGFPTHSQMIGGLHTENGVADGKVMAKGVMLPPNLADDAPPPEHEDDDDHSQLSREHHALSVKADDEKSHVRRASSGQANPAASPSDGGSGANLSVHPSHHRTPSGGSVSAAHPPRSPSPQPTPSPAPIHHGHSSSVPALNMTPHPVMAPSSAPVVHHVAGAHVAAPASNPSAHAAAAAVVYTPIVPANLAFPKGIAGHCYACGKGADFVDSQTKVAVCGKDCKLVWLAYQAKQHPTPAASPAAAPAPLPAGWEQKIDPQSGRVFYQNNVTKTTQWTRPEAASAAATPAPAVLSMTPSAVVVTPPAAAKPKETGWPCSKCTFLNQESVAQCVQCNNPKKPKAAEPVASLKPGEWSCASCSLHNPPLALICAVCRSPKPLAPPSATPVVPGSSPAAKNGWTCSSCTMFNALTATKCDACLKPNPASASASAAKPAEKKKAPLVADLPAGWEAAFDYAHGRLYYKNHITKKTQWEKPTQPAAASAAPKPAGASALPPDIARLVSAGAQVTVYDNAAHPHVQQMLANPNARIAYHGPAHPPAPQQLVMTPQPVMHAPQPQLVMTPQPVMHAQPQAIAVYRTPNGQLVDAQGRIVHL